MKLPNCCNDFLYFERQDTQQHIGEGVDSLNLPELINTFPLMQLSSLRCQLSPFNAFSAERFVFAFFLDSGSVLKVVSYDFAVL